MKGGVVIIGAGQAGARTAFELRTAGYGERIILVGEEAHAPYERPILSKEMISDTHADVTWVANPDDYRDATIELRLSSKVTAIDRHNQRVILSDGSSLDYETLVLATGGVPRQLPVTEPRICTLRTIEDALHIRQLAGEARRIAIVGGGVIGLELASTLRAMGLEVMVIEQAAQVLGRGFPRAIVAHLEDLHKEAGVGILTSTRISDLCIEDTAIKITLESGEQIECDLVVVGIGITPNVELAEQAGLEIENGIVVDGHYRTSDKNILAVGDCACRRDESGNLRRLETWQNANLTAITAAASITGCTPKNAEVPWFWTDQLGRNVQLAGTFDDSLTSYAQRGNTADSKIFLYVRHNILVGAATVNAAREMAVCRRLILAHKEINPALLEAEQFDIGALQTVLRARA